MILTKIYNYVSSWFTSGIDPSADALTASQAAIIMTLNEQSYGYTSYGDVPTAKELFSSMWTIGCDWFDYEADLTILNRRMFLCWDGGEDDRVLISPRGAYIAKECQKKKYA